MCSLLTNSIDMSLKGNKIPLLSLCGDWAGDLDLAFGDDLFFGDLAFGDFLRAALISMSEVFTVGLGARARGAGVSKGDEDSSSSSRWCLDSCVGLTTIVLENALFGI